MESVRRLVVVHSGIIKMKVEEKLITGGARSHSACGRDLSLSVSPAGMAS